MNTKKAKFVQQLKIISPYKGKFIGLFHSRKGKFGLEPSKKMVNRKCIITSNKTYFLVFDDYGDLKS